MKITIEPDIDGDPQEPRVYTRVIDFALAGRKKGKYLLCPIEPITHSHLNKRQDLFQLIGAIEEGKARLLMWATNGSRHDSD